MSILWIHVHIVDTPIENAALCKTLTNWRHAEVLHKISQMGRDHSVVRLIPPAGTSLHRPFARSGPFSPPCAGCFFLEVRPCDPHRAGGIVRTARKQAVGCGSSEEKRRSGLARPRARPPFIQSERCPDRLLCGRAVDGVVQLRDAAMERSAGERRSGARAHTHSGATVSSTLARCSTSRPE